MNKEFAKWEKGIELKLKEMEGEVRYRDDLELLRICQEHIKTYSKEIKGKEIVGLVHPFYLSLSHMHHIKTKEANKNLEIYIKNLKKVFEEKPREIVVFDTIHHYATITSLLLEREMIDKVILTEFDHGNILYPLEKKSLKNKIKFMGGGYYGRCLSTTISQLKSNLLEKEKIWAIHDLTLGHPNFYPKLFPNFITNVPHKRVVDLEYLFRSSVESKQNL